MGVRPPSVGSSSDVLGSDRAKLRFWYSAVAAARAGGTSPVNVAMIGDSETEWRNASPVSSRWVDLLRDDLRARFQPADVRGGYGYNPVSFVNGVTPYTAFNGGLALESGGAYGLGRRVARLQSAGQGVTISPPLGTTSVDLCYTTAGTAVATWNVDAGAQTGTISVATTSVEGAQRITTLNPAVAHTITLTWTSGGTLWYQGAMFYGGDESAGIRVWEGGASGMDVQGYADSTTWARALSRVFPQLVILGMGTNNWGNNAITPGSNGSAYYQQKIAEIIALIRTNANAVVGASPAVSPPIVLWSQWERGDVAVPSEPWSNYVQAMKNIAAGDSGVVFFDFGARVGRAVDDRFGLIDPDTIHGTNKLHRMQADAFMELLAPTTARSPTRLLPQHVRLNPAMAASKVGVWTMQVASAVPQNFHYLSDGVQNDSLTFPVLLAEGTWKLDLLASTGVNRGIFTVALDGNTVGTLDTYAASSSFGVFTVSSIAVPTSGIYSLTLTMASKNASSSSFIGTPVDVGLTKTG